MQKFLRHVSRRVDIEYNQANSANYFFICNQPIKQNQPSIIKFISNNKYYDNTRLVPKNKIPRILVTSSLATTCNR